MKFKTLTAVAFGTAAALFSLAPDGELGFAAAQAQTENVRPEVGKLLRGT